MSVESQLSVISDQNVWKCFNLLNVIHFLSYKNNKGYEFKCSFHSFYQPPLFSFWWNCFNWKVSKQYKWSPWYTKITSNCGVQYQVQSDGGFLKKLNGTGLQWSREKPMKVMSLRTQEIVANNFNCKKITTEIRYQNSKALNFFLKIFVIITQEQK